MSLTIFYKYIEEAVTQSVWSCCCLYLLKNIWFVIHRLTENMRRLSEYFCLSNTVKPARPKSAVH